MRERKVLETDEEFTNMLPAILKFSLMTKTPVWQNIGEIADAFSSHSTIVFLDIVDGQVVRYLSGYGLGQGEFYISQALWLDDNDNVESWYMYEEEIKRRGARKIVCTTFLPPEMLEKYGLTFERFIFSKVIKEN